MQTGNRANQIAGGIAVLPQRLGAGPFWRNRWRLHLHDIFVVGTGAALFIRIDHKWRLIRPHAPCSKIVFCLPWSVLHATCANAAEARFQLSMHKKSGIEECHGRHCGKPTNVRLSKCSTETPSRNTNRPFVPSLMFKTCSNAGLLHVTSQTKA